MINAKVAQRPRRCAEENEQHIKYECQNRQLHITKVLILLQSEIIHTVQKIAEGASLKDARASPKSQIFNLQSALASMFLGFKSRWNTFAATNRINKPCYIRMCIRHQNLKEKKTE